ncbi:MAG TPA: glycosyltransferase family 4 protein [Rhizomicrobium sp.]|nr:glycosyltransferase family 4 protein [Rhizomicrobium sp.]
MKTLLYATYVSPFPANSGERIRVLNLISALRSLGYAVEAFVGNYDGIDLQSHCQDGINFHQIPFSWPRLRQATGIYFRSHAGFMRDLASLHARKPLTAAVLDYGFIGAHIDPIAQLGIPVVLGTHNVESALTGQVPKRSPGARAAIGLRQMVERTHERLFFPRADAVICVSEEDRQVYKKFIPARRLHLIPNFVDIPDQFRQSERLNRIVMSGSFDNFQNREGLRWFAEQVWDGALRERTQLHVVGKRSDEAVRALKDVRGITGLGARDDLLAEIGTSRCAIVPLLHGGGTRVKCLEAMAARTPVVTTSKGCEGIAHGGAFWVADTPAAFRDAILEVFSDAARAQARAAEARRIFDKAYSLPANLDGLDHVLASAACVRFARSRRDHRPVSGQRTSKTA